MSETRLFKKRQSGVVMPIFSLPSPYGIGTLGKCAYDFVDQLVTAKQKYWQILPLGHTGFGDSPYQCFSTVAGNPYFIDLDMLVQEGLLKQHDLVDLESASSEKIDYSHLAEVRLSILYIAYKNCSPNLIHQINTFAEENADWIIDYALFMSLKKHFSQKPVWEWDDPKIKLRQPDAIRFYSDVLSDDIEFYYFIQYFFFKQWNALKEYANQKGILFIGDIPMYPSPDSVDVWANRSIFKVDDSLRPYKAAGVPPDIYSETGQLWGNPVYDWNVIKQENYKWWIWRIRHTLNTADVIRIDHFRAFQDYWEVPGNDTTALNGMWVPGPRMDLFKAIKAEFGEIPIIAEDLGIIDDSVRELLAQTGFPGMNVLIFGLNAEDDSTHLPHNWKVNSVGYTSTHDSETFCHAVKKASAADKDFALSYFHYSPEKESLGFAAVRTAWASTAQISMAMITDLLSLEEEGRINTPSTLGGNWNWRLKPGQLSEEILLTLANLTKLYKRI